MTRTASDKQPPQPPERLGRVSVIAAVAHNTGLAAFARAGFSDPALILHWTEIAGPDVARLAQPLRFAQGPGGGTLTLKALPGAALFLAHEKRALAGRINAYLGRPVIAQIKFIQGPLPVHPIPKNAEKKSGPLPATDPARVWRGPEGLKSAIEALARRRSPAP